MNEKYLPPILERITGMECCLSKEANGSYLFQFLVRSDGSMNHFSVPSLDVFNIIDMMFKVGQWYEADHIGRIE